MSSFPPNMMPPGGMPPDMGGVPPPMDPAMMGGDPPMPGSPEMFPPGMGGNPAPPGPPPNPAPENPFVNIVAMLRQMAETQGIEAAQEIWMFLPPSIQDGIRKGVRDVHDDLMFIESLEPKAKQPVYPVWFQPPPKPKFNDVTQLAFEDEMEWRETRNRMQEDLNLLYTEQWAVPDDFDAKEDKPFKSSSMSDEARAVAAMLGAITPNYEIPFSKLEHEQAAQDAENALYYWDDIADEWSLSTNNGDYGMAAAGFLVYTGYVATRIRFNPEDPENPFQEQFVNPATLAPVWDGRSLLRVTRRYVDTVANVISDYEDNKGSVKRKLLNKKRNKSENNSDGNINRMTDRIMVTVYHDRWWTCVIADDVEIVPVQPHHYGFVPYCIQGSGNGEPSAITSLTDQHSPGSKGVANARERWEKKNLSWFGFRKQFHAQFEEIMSLVMTVFQKVANPALVLKQSPFAEVDGDPEIHTEAGGITKLNDQEDLGPLVENPSALSAFTPLMNAVNQDASTNRLTPSFFGLAQSTQMSGNAMETEYEAGRDKVATFLVALESFYSQRASMRLRMYRDWGHLIQNDDGDYGKTIIPYAKPVARLKGRKWFELTPGTLEESGVRAKAICTHVRMQNLAALGNAASVWMQFGGMSAFEAMELRGVRDPHMVMEQRRYEKAMLDEAMEKAVSFGELMQRDPASALFYRELVLKLGNGAPGATTGGGDQAGMQGPLPGGPNTSAMNLESIGMGNGGMGRPAGGSGLLGPSGQPLQPSPIP
jgi:hypothetical protein